MGIAINLEFKVLFACFLVEVDQTQQVLLTPSVERQHKRLLFHSLFSLEIRDLNVLAFSLVFDRKDNWVFVKTFSLVAMRIFLLTNKLVERVQLIFDCAVLVIHSWIVQLPH